MKAQLHTWSFCKDGYGMSHWSNSLFTEFGNKKREKKISKQIGRWKYIPWHKDDAVANGNTKTSPGWKFCVTKGSKAVQQNGKKLMFILKSYSVFMFDFALGVFKKVFVFISLSYLELAWIFLCLISLCFWVKWKTVGYRAPYTSLGKNGRGASFWGRVRGGEVQIHCGQTFTSNAIWGGDRPRILSPSGPTFAGVVENGPTSLHLEFLFCIFSGSEA